MANILARFRQEDLMAVLRNKDSIMVGVEGADMEPLDRTQNRERVPKPLRAWNMLIVSIQYPPVPTHILTVGSSSERWEIASNTLSLKQKERSPS